MPNWDDPRGPRYEGERERWRRETMRERGGPRGERRSFGEERGYDDGRDERYARRRPDERYGYEDAGESAWRRRRAREDAARFDNSATHGGEPYAYGGQEYGLEGHPGVASSGGGGGAGWGFERGVRGERLANFDWDDPGVGQSQAGYDARARSHPDHEFDSDYLRWRDEQLRAHDRDYQDWRRDQHRQYDEQYRQFRSERQRHFGQAFHEWRSQRSAVGGVADTGIGSVGQGQGGYGDKTGIPGGYNAASAVEKPSGFLDPPGHLSADPAMSQSGGIQAASGDGAAGPRSTSSEFGKEPGPVQAASGGKARDERR